MIGLPTLDLAVSLFLLIFWQTDYCLMSFSIRVLAQPIYAQDCSHDFREVLMYLEDSFFEHNLLLFLAEITSCTAPFFHKRRTKIH